MEGQYSGRNATNRIVDDIYRNVPINVTGTDEPEFDAVINKVQSTVHAYTKYLSVPPEIKIPVYNPSNEVLGKAARRKRILQLWLKENSWAIKWLTIIRSCSMFGYQGVHLGLASEMETKFAMILDDPNMCYAVPKSYDDSQIDLYMVKKRISGKQIYDIYLGGSKPYGNDRPVTRKHKELSINDDPEEFFDVLIAWDDTYSYTIDMSNQKMIGPIMYHGLGEPPAVMLKNFPNPGYAEGISDVAHVLAINHYLNTMLTNIADVINYETNPIAVATNVPPNLDISKMIKDKGIIQLEDERSKFEFVKHPGVAPSSFNLYDMVEVSSEQQTSMTNLANSGHSGTRKIDSGPAVSSLNVGVEAMLNVKRQMMSTGLSKLFGMYLRRVDAIYLPEVYGDAANIQVGSPDSESSFTFNADDIKGEYNVDVIFTQGAFDLMARAQLAQQMWKDHVIPMRTYRQMCNVHEDEDTDKLIALEMERQIQYEAKLKAAQDGNLQPGGNEFPQETGGMPSPIEGAVEGAMPQNGMPQMPGQGMMPTVGDMGGMPQGAMPQEGMGGGDMGGMLQGMLPAMQEGMAGGDISQDIMKPNAGMDEEEISVKVENITGLKGEIMFIGVKGDKIIIALEDMSDQQAVRKALPEYDGQIEFVSMSEATQ